MHPDTAAGALRPVEASDALLSFRNVSLRLSGRSIIEDMSLELRPQEFVCVVGPSGCGKTTLLRLMAGLMLPSSGEVRYRNEIVRRPASDVALIFQDYSKALLPWRTAAGNVALALEAMGAPRAERRDRIAALLKRVGLAAFADKYPSQMSGGMQQ